MRRTRTLLAVLAALLERPDDEHWGYDLQRATGIRSGALYPILRRLHEADWLEDGWEDPSVVDGRPPRRYYRLTPNGTVQAKTMLAATGAHAEAPSKERFA